MTIKGFLYNRAFNGELRTAINKFDVAVPIIHRWNQNNPWAQILQYLRLT